MVLVPQARKASGRRSCISSVEGAWVFGREDEVRSSFGHRFLDWRRVFRSIISVRDLSILLRYIHRLTD